MATNSGLAKAYKYVTTQVTWFQKRAPKLLGELQETTVETKERGSHVNSETFPLVYNHDLL